MADVPAIAGGSPREVKPPAVGPRLARVLLSLATGQFRSQREACAAEKFSTRSLQRAMRKPHVRSYMQEIVLQSLGLTAVKAAKRIDELMTSSPNEKVCFEAARYAIGTRPGLGPPQSSSTSVNISIGDRVAGFVIDLSEGNSQPHVIHAIPASELPAIEGEAVEVDEAD